MLESILADKIAKRRPYNSIGSRSIFSASLLSIKAFSIKHPLLRVILVLILTVSC